MESAAAETVTGDNENSNNNVTANDTENGVKGGPNPSLSQEPEPVPESPSKDVPWASIQGVTDHNVCASVEEMEDSVYFLFPDWRQRQSRFWILLVSAAVIATAGVVGNSTATVIGAMIVAPLMVPIQGLMVSSVLLNGKNWLMSLLMCCAGIGSVILIGYLLGLGASDNLFTKENNSQVSARVAPAMTDLVGALATGVVGAVSIVRKDIAGALPGVAISISLVPPLCVVGLMLSIQSFSDATGAFLLFITNFLCIQVTGIITMYLFGVHKHALDPNARKTLFMFIVCVAALCVVAVPLYFTSQQLATEADAKACLEDYINGNAGDSGWRVSVVVAQSTSGVLEATVALMGPPPLPNFDEIDATGITEACPMVNVVQLSFIPAKFFEF